MNEDKINIIRHSCSHLMAQAVRELFPTTKVAIGPAIENGFYYDFDSEHIFTPEDLLKIEEKMNELINKNIPIVKEVWAKQKALDFFEKQGEIYKVELIKDLPDDEVTIYQQGNFVDLCRGPHLASTKEISKAFKLNKIAGAYWRGDSKNKMLQRIYGLCFETKEELKKYLEFLEEAEKRDHRKIGKEMDLFHFEYDYAPGAVFWHHNGFIIYRKMIEYIRKRQEAGGYIEVSTPAVMDRSLWETSGHWQKYGAHNYSGKTEDEKVFCIKPMNCPGGVLLYKNTMHSYRDLPMRVAEFGKVHRYEASGALMGLMRVREFTQDDAHIYCTPEQMELETITTLKLILDIYKVFGFDDIEILLSTRPLERIGSDEIWDLCEKSLQKALEKNGYNYKINEGEGAFYGPKVEFVLKDAIGRKWQCGTIQVDMNLPERFDISYIGDDGEKHRPVMLHRALFGSIERFMGILIEHYAGKLPLWLMPVQVMVAPITSEQNDYALKVQEVFKNAGIRAQVDLRNEKINYKIREHSMAKIPFILVVGNREMENNSVAIRTLGSNEQKISSLPEALKNITETVIEP